MNTQTPLNLGAPYATHDGGEVTPATAELARCWLQAHMRDGIENGKGLLPETIVTQCGILGAFLSATSNTTLADTLEQAAQKLCELDPAYNDRAADFVAPNYYDHKGDAYKAVSAIKMVIELPVLAA